MKVKVTPDMKRIITIDEIPAMNETIAAMKNEDVHDYAIIAARLLLGGGAELIEAQAEICKNSRIWNEHSNDSRNFDIWISFTAYAETQGFVKAGANLSDIYQIGNNPDTDNEIERHMFIRRFKEC